MSLYNFDKSNNKTLEFKENSIKYTGITKDISNFALPFSNNFVKYNEDTFIFIREFSPNTITGTCFITDIRFKPSNSPVGFINMPFKITLDNNTFNIDILKDGTLKDIEEEIKHKWVKYLKERRTPLFTNEERTEINNLKSVKEISQRINELTKAKRGHLKMIQDLNFIEAKQKFVNEWEEIEKKYSKELITIVVKTCNIINTLNHRVVATDNYSNPNQRVEYYRRKHEPTIRVPARPIYYVLGDKQDDVSTKFKSIQSRGHLEYSHAFKVRGHWRRIDEKSLGKDRNGNYGIHGHTWVNEYIKGEGELTKRLRVIKN